MLEWNVYIGNFQNSADKYNIFNHWRFFEDCQRNYKKNKDDKDVFLKQLRRDLMYYFWSKTEWEVVITHWPPHRDDEERFNKESIKVDVFDQVRLNWDVFCDYVWSHKDEFKVKRSRSNKAKS